MTTPTPPSALDAERLDLIIERNREASGADCYDEEAAAAITQLRAQLAEARAERDRLVERAKRTPQFLHYPDVPEVVALRTQVAALLAEREEVARPWELPEGTKLCSARLDAILTRKSVAGPFSAPPDPAWYDLPPYLNLTALLAAARLRAPVEVK